MSPQVVLQLKERLSRLQNRRQEIDERLNQESRLSWGEEHIMRKQELLRERAFIDDQLSDLGKALREAQSLTQSATTYSFTVEFGSHQRTFSIVPRDLVAPARGLISYDSPLAKALQRSKVGEQVSIVTPTGVKAYRVISTN